MRLIDVDEIKLPQGFFEKVDNVPKFYEWLDTLPTVEAEPIRHGHWKPYKTEQGRTLGIYCSKCRQFLLMNATPYCPNCGAKMDEVKDND